MTREERKRRKWEECASSPPEASKGPPPLSSTSLLQPHFPHFSLIHTPSLYSSLILRLPTSMFGRLSQLTRHLSRPALSFSPAATSPLSSSSLSPLRTPSTMTLPAIANATKTIHTAACLIIGDEVLGGKVGGRPSTRGPTNQLKMRKVNISTRKT